MVSSFTQLLQQKYSDKSDDDANAYIMYAVDGSKRMYDLLNGLLAYSRVNTRGKAYTAIDMNKIMSVVLENLRLRIEETDADITLNELPLIHADRSQMIQLLQNLLENAMKFSNDKPVIVVSYTDKGNFHQFSIKDNGIGIEQKYHDRIFHIFQRLNVREFKGTGIGLALCKRIVERHGGTIWVESDPGKGSLFKFTIPKVLQ